VSATIAELKERVRKLKDEINAVILAHNYMRPEIQDVADLCGDSLGLSVAATKTKADVIVFCGVDFMAESAKVLNPGKIVLHPEQDAGCPMAEMIDVEGLKMAKSENPDAAVVAYVNSSAAVKAESDICCTSSNALKVVKSVPQREVIFIPDSNLGLYLQRFDHGKEMMLWPGYCPTHIVITPRDVAEMRRRHPQAVVVAHPENTPEVIDVADQVFSTQGMVKFCQESPAREFIIATEREMCYRLERDMPEKRFYSFERAVCPNMKKVTIERLVRAMEALAPRVEIPEETRERAYLPLKRMIDLGRGD
jgi:quinolinate synthase